MSRAETKQIATPTLAECPTIDDSPHSQLADRYQQVRRFSESIAAPLSSEDATVQSMPDVSPTKWHLAHTSWFFETFVLTDGVSATPFHDEFGYLFNSYYNTVGSQFPRDKRGLISRPGLSEVLDYRRDVDRRMAERLGTLPPKSPLLGVINLGLQHEQQHQELMLTDIKHVLSQNPLMPTYREGTLETGVVNEEVDWISTVEGIREIGYSGEQFHFDNEAPRHRVFVDSFEISDRLVTCGEYLRFIDDGGYQRPELWLSQGWAAVNNQGWQAPLYWSNEGSRWRQFTLGGVREIDASLPVTHVSYFEADAFARWSGARLATEAEWEVAAADANPISSRSSAPFADSLWEAGAMIHPPAQPTGSPDFLGSVWEWTASQYVAYPGYAPPSGALGEYNGKFMCNQHVLRGGSCASSQSHIRESYRNFFPADTRWQFSGIRLCR